MNGPAMGLLDRISGKPQQVDPPESVDVDENRLFRIVWPGGREVRIASLALRDACPCAGCVEEGTGRKILDTAALPLDVRPVQIEPVGSYAIKVHWSDGHDTGIYSWSFLRDLTLGPA
jgi:DUF971 family protein